MRARIRIIGLMGIAALVLATPALAAPEAPVMLAPGEQPPNNDPPPPVGGGQWPASPNEVGLTSDRCPNWNSVKTSRGGFDVTQDGATLSNLEVSGQISVKAKNVTLRCVRTTGGRYGIACGGSSAPGCSGLVVEDSEIRNASSAGVLFFGGNSVLRRSHVHDNVDGVKITSSGNTVEDSYIHDLRDNDGKCHCDGIQYRGGSNNTFRRNYISGRRAADSPYKANSNATSATINQAADGSISRFTVEDNLFDGGGFGMYLTKKSTCTTCSMSNVHVRRNRFVPGSFSHGPLSTNVSWSSACLVWEGNAYLNGSSIGTPGGARSSGSCF